MGYARKDVEKLFEPDRYSYLEWKKICLDCYKTYDRFQV